MAADLFSELPPMESLTFHTDLTKPNSCPAKYVPGEHVLLPHLLDHHDAANEWYMIEAGLENLSSPLDNSHRLEDIILSYNQDQRGVWNFDLLHHVVNHVLSEQASAELLQVTVPMMARLALQLPQLLPRPLPLLRSGHSGHVSLSQRQVASLLAHAFFCTYPRRNNPRNQFANYPTINFNGLFCYHAGRSEDPLVAKLLCIFNYFKRVTSEESPSGVVTFSRRHLDAKDVPTWNSLQTPLNLNTFSIDPKGKIEVQGASMLQVSFANKKLGGGVLDSGYVQEEIRCITCPEMIVARLFTEFLDHREALVITGVERYNSHSGYAGTFRFTGDYYDETPRDESGRRKCSVLAIDALNFSRPVQLPTSHSEEQAVEERPSNILARLIYLIASYCRSLAIFFRIHYKNKPEKKSSTYQTFSQYDAECITRELNKAYVGFRNIDKQGPLTPIASGNWGCGVFKGDPLLKFILQLLAASEAGRDLKYFTFGGFATVSRIETLVQALHRKELTVGTLYVALCHYHLHGGDLTQYLIRKLNLIPATSVTTVDVVPVTPLVIVENPELITSRQQADVKTPENPNQEETKPTEINQETNILADKLANNNCIESLDPNVAEETKTTDLKQETNKSADILANNNLIEGLDPSVTEEAKIKEENQETSNILAANNNSIEGFNPSVGEETNSTDKN